MESLAGVLVTNMTTAEHHASCARTYRGLKAASLVTVYGDRDDNVIAFITLINSFLSTPGIGSYKPLLFRCSHAP